MTGRADLLDDAIGWLDDDATLDDLLGADGDVFPAQIAEGKHADDTVQAADPRVFVAVSKTTSARNNRLDESTLEVRAIVDATPAWVRQDGSIDALTRIMDRVDGLLSEHRDGYTAQGSTGDPTPIEVSRSTTRYTTVGAWTFETEAPHARHTD